MYWNAHIGSFAHYLTLASHIAYLKAKLFKGNLQLLEIEAVVPSMVDGVENFPQLKI